MTPRSPRRATGIVPVGLAVLAVVVLAASLAGGCASRRGPAPGAPTVPGTAADGDFAESADAMAVVPHLAERALLLLLVDRQSYDGFVVQRALGGPPVLRRELAVALGRMDDPRSVRPLAGLLLDDAVPVRRAAAFALGELAQDDAEARAEARSPLLAAVTDPDRDTGRLAVEALAKAGVPVLEVGARLLALDEQGLTPEEAQRERWARLLPSLFRFTQSEDEASVADAVALADSALAADDLDLHRWAAYALARNPVRESLPLLRDLLADPEPRIRAWAARGIGVLADQGAQVDRRDLERLQPLLASLASADVDSGPAIQALGAARTIIDTGRAAAPASWVPTLLALFDHPEPGVRVAALDASAAWLGEPELSAALAARVTGGDVSDASDVSDISDVSTWERSRALLALAAGGDPKAEELALALAQEDDPVLRTTAAAAAAELAAPGRAMAAILSEDPSPRVRQAAADSLRTLAVAADRPPAELAAVVAPFLADPDSGVRTGALGFLEDRPVVPLDLLERSALSSLRSDSLEERLAAVAAVASRARAEPTERGALIRVLETLITEGDLPTRRAAAAALEELGGERIAVGPVATGRGVEVYRRMLLDAARPRLVRIETDRGALTVRLHCPDFPLTCLNFLQLAEGRFYDGLVFHRAVPDFVVQAGDPRGDGWGGPGYQIRDEIGRLRYDRGVLGMALAGPDTGGSQWFITLAPQPHLDGGYTAFGEVVAGAEVLPRIHQGDTILSVRELGDR